MIKILNEALKDFNIKIAAAYSRLRIEKKAHGSTTREQMENILPLKVRQKEEIAGFNIFKVTVAGMPKTVRVNNAVANRTSVFKTLGELGYLAIPEQLSRIEEHHQENLENLIYIDDDFEDLVVIPAGVFDEIKSGPLLNNGSLILQV